MDTDKETNKEIWSFWDILIELTSFRQSQLVSNSQVDKAHLFLFIPKLCFSATIVSGLFDSRQSEPF